MKQMQAWGGSMWRETRRAWAGKSACVLCILLGVVGLSVSAVQFDTGTRLAYVPEPAFESVESISTEAVETGSIIPPPIFQGTVQSGQSCYSLLQEAGVSAAEIATVQQAVQEVYDLGRLRVGQPYQIVVTSDGHLLRFVYEIDTRRQLEVERQEATFHGRVGSIAYEMHERVVQGEIQDSLYDTLAAQGEPLEIATQLAEIFAGYIDFHTDIREGDTFRVLLEDAYRDGQAAGMYRILAAELVNQQRLAQAIYYPPGKADGAFYRPDGQSLRRMFLRSPLRYTRISSRFSYRRFHPVLKRYRPHLGVDYAAPTGTPVHSVAGGVVRWVGRKGGNGHMVKIQHPQGYMTYYLHLSRYARGLRPGKRIKQGQLIGYVGSTGLSTGPHLDFRISKHGKYLNPLQLKKNVAAAPLPKRTLPVFQEYAARQLAKLSQTAQRLTRTTPLPGVSDAEHNGK